MSTCLSCVVLCCWFCGWCVVSCCLVLCCCVVLRCVVVWPCLVFSGIVRSCLFWSTLVLCCVVFVVLCCLAFVLLCRLVKTILIIVNVKERKLLTRFSSHLVLSSCLLVCCLVFSCLVLSCVVLPCVNMHYDFNSFRQTTIRMNFFRYIYLLCAKIILRFESLTLCISFLSIDHDMLGHGVY